MEESKGGTLGTGLRAYSLAHPLLCCFCVGYFPSVPGFLAKLNKLRLNPDLAIASSQESQEDAGGFEDATRDSSPDSDDDCEDGEGGGVLSVEDEGKVDDRSNDSEVPSILTRCALVNHPVRDT